MTITMNKTCMKITIQLLRTGDTQSKSLLQIRQNLGPIQRVTKMLQFFMKRWNSTKTKNKKYINYIYQMMYKLSERGNSFEYLFDQTRRWKINKNFSIDEPFVLYHSSSSFFFLHYYKYHYHYKIISLYWTIIYGWCLGPQVNMWDFHDANMNMWKRKDICKQLPIEYKFDVEQIEKMCWYGEQ